MQTSFLLDGAILPAHNAESDALRNVDDFVQDVPTRLIELAQCVVDHDWVHMGDLAEILTQESADSGFSPISRLSLQLQMACRNEDDEGGILTALEQLDTALRRVRIKS